MFLAAVDVPPAQAGPLGLVVLLLLIVATVLLLRSMLRHLRRVPTRFEAPAEPEPATARRAFFRR